MTLTQYPTSEPFRAEPQGLVIEPVREEYGAVFAFAAPYLDMQIQLLSWMGLSARVGYLWAPVELDWSDNGQLDSPQDLSPSGVYVRCSIMFGGIGRTGSAEDSIGRDEELRLLRAESVVSGNGAADSEEEVNGVPEED